MHAGRILAVEDDDDLRALLVRHLTEQGYAVRAAADIAEGRALLAEWLPDLLLLDIQLPDGSGFELCQEARAHSSVPIIFLTCVTEDEAVVRGLGLGGDDYIAKPFSLDVLTARISARLRGAASAGRIELPPLSVDMVTATATLDGVRVDLSKKELQLLTFLALHAGQGFSSEDLLASVWQDTSSVPTNTVRVHVSTLRRKLHLDDPGSAFTLRCTASGRYVFQKIRFSPPGTGPGDAPATPACG